MAVASIEFVLDKADILARMPWKYSTRQCIDVALTNSEAIAMMEAGWDVRCLTPGDIVGNAVSYNPHRARVADDYILYIRVVVTPFWGLSKDTTIWIIPTLIERQIPTRLRIARLIMPSIPDEYYFPTLMYIEEPNN